MKVKEGEADHELKDEAEHPGKKEQKKEARTQVKERIEDRSITNPQELEQFFDSLESSESEAQRKKINYWDSPELLELIEDEAFQKALDSACRRAINLFPVSPIYSLEDLKYDVMERFGKWLRMYRHDASLLTVLRRIAYSQLVDISRRANERCVSLEDLELEGINVEALQSRNSAADIYHDIQAQEWLDKLETPKERELFREHFIEGKRKSDIAREHGVTRQAVAKQIERIAEKLRPYV